MLNSSFLIASNGERYAYSRTTPPQIRIPEITQYYPFSTRPEIVGWYARTLKGEASVNIQLTSGTQIIGEVRIPIDQTPKAITIPWPLVRTNLSANIALNIRFNLSESQSADLMINRSLDRSELTTLAHGNGIEVGPGPKPQIVNSQDIRVKYVEEMSAGEWKNLYDKEGQYESDQSDWSNHLVGKACNLPCEDESLDFIFSSHVFEHLSNPIGHLEHWASKLKSGGTILAVVPDIAGTKDYRHKPSTLDEMREEYANEIWEPTPAHYRRWASTRRGWANKVDEAIAEKRSIHVHFYTRENVAALLDYVIGQLPFESYHIRHTPNHRDFYWVLIKK